MMDYVKLFTHTYAFLLAEYFLGVVLIVAASRGLQRMGVDRRIQKEWPPLRQYIIEFMVSSRSIAVNSIGYVMCVYLIHRGMFPHAGPAAYDLPWWRVATDAIIMFIAHDAYFYWTHRIMHHRKLFRWMHLEHHLARSPTPMTSMRMTIPEAMVQSGFFILWGALMPDSPISFQIVLFYIIFIGAVGHSGFEWSITSLKKHPWLAFLTTVTHHDLHHLGSYNKNYAIHFTFWDRICGTHNYAYEPKLIKFLEDKKAAREAKKAAKNDAPATAPAE